MMLDSRHLCWLSIIVDVPDKASIERTSSVIENAWTHFDQLNEQAVHSRAVP